jgi:mono/diheme cytochrome c family protein
MRILILILALVITGYYRLISGGISGARQDELPKSIERGKEVYNLNCLGCHQVSGEGLPGVYPPLAKSDHLDQDQIKSIVIILKGQNEEIRVNGTNYNVPMTSLNQLTDQQVADVLNYIGNNWGNHFSTVTPAQVKSKRN